MIVLYRIKDIASMMHRKPEPCTKAARRFKSVGIVKLSCFLRRFHSRGVAPRLPLDSIDVPGQHVTALHSWLAEVSEFGIRRCSCPKDLVRIELVSRYYLLPNG